MPIVEHTADIRGTPAQLFALTRSYELHHEWDPFLREMRLLNGATEVALGVREWVRAYTGLSMEVEYISFAPPHAVAMKMVRGPFFFAQFAGSWRFKAVSACDTAVTFRYSFKTRWKKLEPLLDKLICRVFQRDVRARVLGLKRGVEEKGLLVRYLRLIAHQPNTHTPVSAAATNTPTCGENCTARKPTNKFESDDVSDQPTLSSASTRPRT
jgi:ribosome-associated toxin RatA of RatAB toxin-antitoxin module